MFRSCLKLNEYLATIAAKRRIMAGNSLVPAEMSATDFREIAGSILPKGHAIHGYSNSLNTRMLMVLESREYSDHAPLLGFGMDGNAERALGRALLTYAMRERDGLEHITEQHYPESTEARIPTDGHPSRFDNIVWGGDFWMYQSGDMVIAGSAYGGGPGGMSKLEVAGPDAFAAITSLADNYTFFNDNVKKLPAIAFE